MTKRRKPKFRVGQVVAHKETLSLYRVVDMFQYNGDNRWWIRGRVAISGGVTMEYPFANVRSLTKREAGR